jgi:hypothetical protein
MSNVNVDEVLKNLTISEKVDLLAGKAALRRRCGWQD